MMPQEEQLKPEQMNALQHHIQQASEKLAHQAKHSNEDELGSLIYMGNVHDSFPRDLIKDPILSSDEIHTWMLMRLEITDQFSITRIPKQSSLQEQLKCSRPIVSRNLQVLRALRWITLCSVVKGPDGQYKGAIYAQHDEPLSLAETLTLDHGYIDFLQTEAKGDVLKRLNHIKASVLKHTNYQLLTEHDPLTEISKSESKSNKFGFSQSNNPLQTHLACPPEAIEPNKEINLYSGQAVPDDIKTILNDDSQNHVKIIDMDNREKSDEIISDLAKTHQNSQKSPDLVHVKNIDTGNHVKNIDTAYSSSSSSSNSFKTNTTTTVQLRIPKCLSVSEKAKDFARDLALKLPQHDQQNILNMIEGRDIAGKQGIAEKMHNPIGFLRTIVQRYKDGTYEPSLYGIGLNNDIPFGNKSPDMNNEPLSDIQMQRQIRELAADIQNLNVHIKVQPDSESKNILIDQRDIKQLDLDDLKRRLDGKI